MPSVALHARWQLWPGAVPAVPLLEFRDLARGEFPFPVQLLEAEGRRALCRTKRLICLAGKLTPSPP